MKRVLGLSKHRQIRVSAQYSLEASGTVPTSGSGAALDNFAGASRAAAELSKALDGVFDWDDFAGMCYSYAGHLSREALMTSLQMILFEGGIHCLNV